MRSTTAVACLLFLVIALFPSPGFPEGMSREQGDAVLDELRRIRLLLERQPLRPGPMARTPAQQGPPPREKVVLRLGNDPSLGRADAPVTIVEYTDYKCGFCGRFHSETFPEIRRNFIDTGKVRFIKRDLPLEIHPEALRAARAALCAGDQGRFQQMHELLSADPEAVGPDSYGRFAIALSLDTKAFDACLASDRHLDEIRASRDGAAAAGIRGTPSFVVGVARGETLDGVGITGAQPYAVFEQAINEYLIDGAAGRAPAEGK
jgi:protein-disulfide isomerase